MDAETPAQEYPNLAEKLGLTCRVFFKREDQSQYGSHKGRSIPVMIDKYVRSGTKKFAISSSGNAAISAIKHIKTLGSDFSLQIYVGKRVNPAKLEMINDLTKGSEQIKVTVSERPLQDLFKACEDGAQSLRQSSDDTALIGYAELAKELSYIPDIKSVYIGSSSGTTAQALAEWFIANKMNVSVNIIQTHTCHPLVDAIVAQNISNEKLPSDAELSLADAIVDKVGLRKNTLAPLIRKTGGTAYIAQNSDIQDAINIVKESCGIILSPNSALSVVGLIKDRPANGSVACIITGV